MLCYSNMPGGPRAQWLPFQLNWMQRRLYRNSKEIPSSQKGLPGGDFHYLLWPFIHLLSDSLTPTFITFIIIYWKISCIKMKSPQKTLGPCLQEGKFLLWKLHKMQPSLWSLRFQLSRVTTCIEDQKAIELGPSLKLLHSYRDTVT